MKLVNLRYNSVITHSSIQKKQKLSFRKAKQGIQSLSYTLPSSWNNLLDNFKSATSANSFKHDITWQFYIYYYFQFLILRYIKNYFKHNIKKYFLEKLRDVEAGIYSYTWLNPKVKLLTILETIQSRISKVSIFSLFRYQDSFQCFP